MMSRSTRVCAWALAGTAACGDDGTSQTGSGGSTSSSSTSDTSIAVSSSDASSTIGAGGTAGAGGAPSELDWVTWTKYPDREFHGQEFDGAWVASDPCVLHDGDVYRMFYTCVAGPTLGGLCEVVSPDGIDWAPAASIDPFVEGLVATGRPDVGWDENIETCAVLRDASRYRLFYSGYPDLDAELQRGPAALGAMTSDDGESFARDPDAPILEPVPGGPDGDDIFSAVAVADGAAIDFVYVGWCVDGYHDGEDCIDGQGIRLLGATLDEEGVFERRTEPVMTARSDLPWLANGVAEPDVVRGPDGAYYLFMTGGLADDEPRVTGVAVGPTAFGPWDVNPEPILTGGEPGDFDACGAFAPSVLIEGDRTRMWYLGIDDCAGACPSCFFEECGCEARFTIGYAEAAWPLRE